MNPTLKASIEVAASAFLTGFLAALAPALSSGPPQSTQWGTILGAAALAGLMSAWHRFQPNPTQVTAAAKEPS